MVLAHVRLAAPSTKVQLVAWQETATGGLLTVKPIVQAAEPGVHCTSRLPGCSRLPSRPSGGRAQAYDLTACEAASMVSARLQVAVAARSERRQASSV